MSDATDHVRWFNRSGGHCGKCGQPGVYCICRESSPCGCRELHPMGSGLADDALDAFAVDVPVDHPELFGGDS